MVNGIKGFSRIDKNYIDRKVISNVNWPVIWYKWNDNYYSYTIIVESKLKNEIKID